MATITVPVPSLPRDWHSTALGLIGAIGLLLKQYMATGTFTYEGVAIAVFIAVVCYFIPAKSIDQAALITTVTGVVNSVAGAKMPASMIGLRAVNQVEQAIVDTAAAVGQPDPNRPESPPSQLLP